MYNLPYHKEQNKNVIKKFIGSYPFVFLKGSDFENKPAFSRQALKRTKTL